MFRHSPCTSILYIACEDDPMQMDLNLRSNSYPFSLGSALCMNKIYIYIIYIESIFRLHKKILTKKTAFLESRTYNIGTNLKGQQG